MDGVRDGVAITAYLVNESRSRRADLARDPLAAQWIPDSDRPAVRRMWDEFASTVYPHDDLVVSLRGRYILDTLADHVSRHPDSVLVVCGAGFSSYPWLVQFTCSIEVDLPEITTAKRRRADELVRTGVADDRDVRYLAADLAKDEERRRVVAEVSRIAAGRPVTYVAEGLVFYLAPADAHAVAAMGRQIDPNALSIVTYWPRDQADNRVLAAQQIWFRRHSVPADATYLSPDELTALLGELTGDAGPEQLQHRYIGRVDVSEAELIPEYVAVSAR